MNYPLVLIFDFCYRIFIADLTLIALILYNFSKINTHENID